MKQLSLAVTVVALASVFIAQPADACTRPETEAGTPTVTEGGNNSGSPGSGSVDEGGTGSGEPISEGGGGGGGAGIDEGGAGGGISEGGGGQEPIVESPKVLLSWTPGRDIDADPNGTAFFRHEGHQVATRVQIRDLRTQTVVLDELVPQYDYASALNLGKYPARTSLTATLAAGRYEARVQSVFSRHGEVKYGLSGQWQDEAKVQELPAMPTGAAAVQFLVSPSITPTRVTGGCSSSASQAAAMFGLILAATLLFRRRA
jgi:MYXO-CTERM domain-containing protein